MKLTKIHTIQVFLVGAGLLVPVLSYASPAPIPTPEPVSLILLGSGLAGLGVAELIRRRRQK
jgi:hypothetical protein